ncbi:MAG: tetratricopeptide repeat protein [Symploca sp. SIO1C2]|nr:tetratricopeptide repeat protein [Symploca sp. SIO1C2]
MLRNAPQAIASGKERVESLLQQHPATKGKQDIQSLVREPLLRLTEAFVQGLIQKANQRPVVLLLDTYEKAPSQLDLWLCNYLLGNSQLQSYPIRLVVAGRQSLLKTQYWRKLQQDRNLVYQQPLERFDQPQTREYLQQIGITESEQVEDIYQVTRGLPYYLDWIRKETATGRELNFSQGNQEIVELLLQGLNSTQKQLLQLAACCRWFDKALIQQLLNAQNLDFDSTADDTDNGFDWLTKQDFVELVQHCYRLDDVARDVFRLSLWQEDRERFYQIHGLLADYFEELAHREVPPDLDVGAFAQHGALAVQHLGDNLSEKPKVYTPNALPSQGFNTHPSPPIEPYNHPDWCSNTAEYLYHALFTHRRNIQLTFISHLFASRYLGKYEVVKIPFQAISAEAELKDYQLLNFTNRQFLTTIQPAVESSWEVLVQEPINWESLANSGFSESQVKAALNKCFSYTASLDGLAKFAALSYQLRRCLEPQCLDWLQQAKLRGEPITTPAEPEFSSKLFLFTVGNEFYELGKIEDAIARYNQAIEFNPDYDAAWYNRGVALYDLGKIEEALASYDQAIEFNPDYEQAWNNRGIVLYSLGKIEEALASYDQAIEFNPTNDAAWNNRGVALQNLGKIEEALASYDQAIEFNPDYEQAWNNRGNALYNLGKIEEAIASYNQAIEFNPNNDAAWYNRVVALQNLGKIEEASASYDQAIELKPNDEQAWNNQGLALYNLGKIEEAVASYDKAIELKPDDEQAWYNRGVALKNFGRVEEAIASYNQAIELKPNYEQAWYNRGVALKNFGRVEEAIASYDQAIELKPDYDAAWNNRGLALVELGKMEEAVASYNKATEFKPDLHQAWYNRGNALYNLGKVEEAIASYTQAIELKPDYDAAWNNLGITLYNLGKIEEAITSYDQAIKLKPDYDAAWNNRGAALYKLGKIEEAIASYDKAIELKPDLHQAWYLKACCYGLQNNIDLAIENLQQAIKINPDKYREMAKTDSDFANIRSESRFQAMFFK